VTADSDPQEWVDSGLLEVASQFVMPELASELFGGPLADGDDFSRTLGNNSYRQARTGLKTSRKVPHWHRILVSKYFVRYAIRATVKLWIRNRKF